MNFPRNAQTVTYLLSLSLLLLALFPTRLAASALTLAWDPNLEIDLGGYNVYYGIRSGEYDFVIDVRNVTQYTVRGLEPEARYYFALTAYDTSDNESDFSQEVSGVSNPETPTSSPSYSEDGYTEWGCFIATAAYGSALSDEVHVFKQFRDEYLLTNGLGRAFVSAYYKYSPPPADYTAKHPLIRRIVRIGLYPILELSKWLVGENDSKQPSKKTE